MRYGIVVRRTILGTSTAFILTTILGCMSFSIGGRNGTITNEDGNSECGKLSVPGNTEMDVYYPTTFTSPPNLTVDSTWNDTIIVSQHADHFHIRNPQNFSRDIMWKARGGRIAPPVTVVVPVPVPVATANVPPAATPETYQP